MNTSATGLHGRDEFVVLQQIALTVNRYEIRGTGPDGADGPLLAMAQQKRLAFREHVTFYADQTRSRPVFSFKARTVMDLGATYDVFDAGGRPIGSFRKDFGRSLMRSTWHVEASGVTAVGTERSKAVAIVRRLQDVVPLPFHFDFVDPRGRPVMSSERRWGLRDRYRVSVPGARLDARVAAALAVALDAQQGR